LPPTIEQAVSPPYLTQARQGQLPSLWRDITRAIQLQPPCWLSSMADSAVS
jgi:hypothetical protein